MKVIRCSHYIVSIWMFIYMLYEYFFSKRILIASFNIVNNNLNSKQTTLRAAVPAYCLLIASPLSAHMLLNISSKALFITISPSWSGCSTPSFISYCCLKTGVMPRISTEWILLFIVTIVTQAVGVKINSRAMQNWYEYTT